MDKKKMMELKTKIEASMSEEDKDSGKYVEMAAMAPKEYAAILMDIAEEERVHRAHLADILWDIQKKMAWHNEEHDTEPEEYTPVIMRKME